jgi:hypothetical protein
MSAAFGLNWLDLSGSSNRVIQVYVKGFVDLSGGNLTVRAGPANNSHIFVQGGDISLNGRLFVINDSSLNGNLSVFGSTLYTTGNTILVGNVNVLNGNLSIGSGLTTAGNALTVGGGVGVTGNTILSGNLTMNGLTSTFTAGNIGVPGGNVVIGTGATSAGNALSVGGSVGVTGNLSVLGNVVISGNLMASQSRFATIYNVTSTNYQMITTEDLSITGNLKVAGGNVIVPNIAIGGATIGTNALAVTGTSAFGGSIAANGGVTVPSSQTLTVATGGTFSLQGATIGYSSDSSNLTINGNPLAAGITMTDGVYTVPAGNITLTSPGIMTAVTFNATSDYRIKANLQVLGDNYIVDVLQPVRYHNALSNKSDIGFIAHEVQEYFPELVTGEKDGSEHQSLNYIGIIGILTKEIQELKKEMKEMRELRKLLVAPPV